MAEFKFNVVYGKDNYKSNYTAWINYEELYDFAKRLLSDGKVQKKLVTDPETFKKTIEPTCLNDVTYQLERIIDEFFDKNTVFSGTDGPTIYIDYIQKNDYVDVATSKPNVDSDDDLFAIINWKVM